MKRRAASNMTAAEVFAEMIRIARGIFLGPER